MELFADCGDIFRIDAAGEPERGSVCFFAEERFGDGLAGAAGDAFDFGVQQNAGFAVLAEVGNVIEVFGGAYACCAVVGEGCAARFRECVGIVRINAVELHRVEYAFLGELDGGFAFDGIGVGNHANEKRRSVIASGAKQSMESAHEFFGGESLGGAEHESEHVGAELGGEETVFFAGDAADFHERAAG